MSQYFKPVGATIDQMQKANDAANRSLAMGDEDFVPSVPKKSEERASKKLGNPKKYPATVSTKRGISRKKADLHNEKVEQRTNQKAGSAEAGQTLRSNALRAREKALWNPFK